VVRVAIFVVGQLIWMAIIKGSPSSYYRGFAKKVGWTKARLNELIKGKRGVTADAALDLSDALGTTAKLWLNLQITFDLSMAIKKRNRAA